ncbi:MAG TPA: hypothetical protein VGZ32_08595 [Actinocrinis sp.]|jgi:hypothetical protein|uniref:hypothetical protein n=1 Tax=Actinocrinis sp. TaxID=1920516 RepID=UPI002DDD3CB9|nr:hypothetical protein [Actinocrinis sp.]HEV3170383.1 hypothetical protein [Actinocrinis sp.]
MSNDLMLFGGGDQGGRGRRGEVARPTRRQRAAVERADIELFGLVSAGKQEEVKAIFRKRLTEDAMQDVTDVAGLARELAGNDQYIASLLIPIVQEYARTTTRDIRDFGRGRGL